MKTREGADAHALRLYVVLHDSFYGKDAKDLHANFDLSPLKYFWGINQFILGRMSSTQLNRISAKQCCYRWWPISLNCTGSWICTRTGSPLTRPGRKMLRSMRRLAAPSNAALSDSTTRTDPRSILPVVSTTAISTTIPSIPARLIARG